MEDTVLLRPDVAYVQVAEAVRDKNVRAVVWGYGCQWQKRGNAGHLKGWWWGIKGVWMTPAWCEEIKVRLQRIHFQHYRHVDFWLVGLPRRQMGRGLELLHELAGYGHRVPMSEGEEGVQKLGCAWLPAGDNGRPLPERY